MSYSGENLFKHLLFLISRKKSFIDKYCRWHFWYKEIFKIWFIAFSKQIDYVQPKRFFPAVWETCCLQGISLKYNNPGAICLFRVNITMIHFVADVTFTEKSYNLATWHACRRKDYVQNLYGSFKPTEPISGSKIWRDNVCLILFPSLD